MSRPHSPAPAGRRGDGRWLSCFRYAWAGIVHTLRTQRNARIHLGISLAVVALSLWLKLTTTEWAVIVLTIAVVFMAEMFNSAIEATIDLASEDYHPLAKIGKDVAAGAVLVCAVLAVVVGLLILGPHLWARLAAWF